MLRLQICRLSGNVTQKQAREGHRIVKDAARVTESEANQSRDSVE